MATKLSTVIRPHWKRFVWMWAFPIAFFLTAFVPAFSQHPLLFFLLVDVPLLFGCSFIASKPIRSGEVTTRQGAVLIVFAPFIIWVVLIFGMFGLAALFGVLG